MAAISFSLADLFEKVFGYKTHAFKPDFKKVQGDSPLLRVSDGVHGSPYYATSAMGIEYFMPVTITYPDNTKLSHQDAGLIGSDGLGLFKSWNLPYPVISISGRKTIVETPLTERRGTVKELINIQDYEIVIKGFIIGATNDFPEDDVATLRNIYEQNSALAIQCPLTDIFLLRPDRSGSDQVVIKDLRFPGIKAVKNVCPYELHMVSDEPFNLIEIVS